MASRIAAAPVLTKLDKVGPSGPPRFASVAQAIEKMQPALPVYALFPKRITRAVRAFLTGFPGETLYAVKANPAPPLLDLIYKAGLRHFDTASLPEVKLIAERFKDATCHFMAPIRIRGTAGEAYRKYGVRTFVIDDERELQRIDEETGVALPSERKNITLYVRLSTPVDGEDGRPLLAAVQVVVDPDDDLSLLIDGALVIPARLRDLRLDPALLDRRDTPALLLDLLHVAARLRFELVRQVFDEVAARERVHGIGDTRLVRDDLLGAKGHALGLVRGQRQRFIEAAQRDALHAAEHGRQRLDRRPHDVVLGLLRDERAAARLP